MYNLKMSISTLIHKKVLIFGELMRDILLIINKLQIQFSNGVH
jgi:hypothetical protein